MGRLEPDDFDGETARVLDTSLSQIETRLSQKVTLGVNIGMVAQGVLEVISAMR